MGIFDTSEQLEAAKAEVVRLEHRVAELTEVLSDADHVSAKYWRRMVEAQTERERLKVELAETKRVDDEETRVRDRRIEALVAERDALANQCADWTKIAHDNETDNIRLRATLAAVRKLLDTDPDPTQPMHGTWWEWIEGRLGGTLAGDLRAILDSSPAQHQTIPLYAMLDVWMALFGSDRSEEFEPWYEEGGYAEAWAEICGFVRVQHQTARDAEGLARAFHENYERLAPEYGYKTREASAVPWDEVPDANKQLMVATAAAVLGRTEQGEQA
jgi:hypothetical protein